MARESFYPRERQVIKKETFRGGERLVRRNHGVPTDIEFDTHNFGRAVFHETTSGITYEHFSQMLGAKTLIFWIYPEDWGVGCGGTCKFFSNGRLELGLWGGVNNYFWATSGGVDYINTGEDSLELDKWYCLALVREADGNSNMYINGELSGDADQDSGTPVLPLTSVVVGNDVWEAFPFYGVMEMFKIYNYCLSAPEILNVYQG